MLRVCCLVLSLAAGLLASPAGEGEENPVSDSSCDLAADFLKAVSKDNAGNILMSPVSIAVLLSMLHHGAQGTTAEQLQTVLHLGPGKSAKEAYAGVLPSLSSQSDENNVTFEWGNGVYIQNGFDLEESYEKAVREIFQSNIEHVDFSSASADATAAKINEWISNVTHEHIQNLIDPNLLGENTVMVMVNAIYFNGIWEEKFDLYKTTGGTFVGGSENSTVMFMKQDERFAAGEDEALGVKWVELPYEDKRYSMLFVLPNDYNGLQAVMDAMTGADLKRFIGNTDTRYVYVTLPKFKFSLKLSLESVLEQLGLTDLFGPGANLAGISKSEKKLSVSRVIHQAEIQVDEIGTVASAAVFDSVQALSFVVNPDQMIFFADHPFLAFLIDKQNQVPVFAAKIVAPSY